MGDIIRRRSITRLGNCIPENLVCNQWKIIALTVLQKGTWSPFSIRLDFRLTMCLLFKAIKGWISVKLCGMFCLIVKALLAYKVLFKKKLFVVLQKKKTSILILYAHLAHFALKRILN